MANRKIVQRGSPAVTLAASGDAEVAHITNERNSLLCFHFNVTGQDLDDFKVEARAHDSAEYEDFTPADWTSLSAGGRFLRASGDLSAVAEGGHGYFEMDISGLVDIKVSASAGGSDGAVVTPYWSLTEN